MRDPEPPPGGLTAADLIATIERLSAVGAAVEIVLDGDLSLGEDWAIDRYQDGGYEVALSRRLSLEHALYALIEATEKLRALVHAPPRLVTVPAGPDITRNGARETQRLPHDERRPALPSPRPPGLGA